MARHYSIVWKSDVLFIPSSVSERLHCTLFLVIMNNAALHICVQVFVQWYVSDFLGCVRRSEIAGLYVVCAQSASVMSDSWRPHGLSSPQTLSMGFSRQEYWSGLPCPLPGDLPDPCRDLTHVSYYVSCIGRQVLPRSTTWEARMVTLFSAAAIAFYNSCWQCLSVLISPHP